MPRWATSGASAFPPHSLANPVRRGAMTALGRIAHVSLAEALSQGPPPAGDLAVPVFSHGTLAVELYTPVGHDPQTPHTRDEIYFVVRGQGLFFDGVERHSVKAVSFLFVPAGSVHRFEQFSSDFAVWVAFYGPEGGESTAEPGAPSDGGATPAVNESV